jgi:replication initiation protein RepC
MTFHRPITPRVIGVNGEAWPAEVGSGLTDAFRCLCTIAERLGLSTGVLHTLRAMMHCVRPEKSLTCFASNETLIRLRAGGSERSVRRHVEQLIKAGVILRNDSPNKKRYMAKDQTTGQVELFGFDLSPMISQLAEWRLLSEDLAADKSRRRFLRTLILGRLHKLDQFGTAFDTVAARRLLRRNLSVKALEEILSTIEDCLKTEDTLSPANSSVAPPANSDGAVNNMADTGGQNDRHHYRSKTYRPESEQCCKETNAPAHIDEAQLLRSVEETCTEAKAFWRGPLKSWVDVHELGWLVAPMLGIDKELMVEAVKRHGLSPVCVLVLILLQDGNRVRNIGAYFRTLVAGPRATTFNPWRMLSSLSDGLRETT